MSEKYKCFRCYQKFHKKYNIQMHLKRKNPCVKDVNNFHNDTEIDIMNNNQFEKKNKKNKDKVNDNKNNTDNVNDNKEIKNYINNQNININSNTTNTTNTTNNFIFNIENLIPFDKDWSTEHLSNKEEIMIIFSKVFYTLFLENILKNENNSNVVIDQKRNKALVYQNKIYEELDLNKLADNSMEKLNKQLKELYKKVYNNINNYFEPEILKNMKKLQEIFVDIEKDIDNKFKNYKNTNKIKSDVLKYLIDIYKENQIKALKYIKSNYQTQVVNNGNGY